MNGEAEGLGATGYGRADAAHADDAQPLAGDAAAHHPSGAPARELARLDDVGPLHHPAGAGQDQRQRHVGGVLRQHAGRVGDGDAALGGRGHVDVVHARAELGDQLQLRPGAGEQAPVQPVGDGGHQRVGGHGAVFGVQLHVEQLAHAELDRIGQLARHDDFGLAGAHDSRARMGGGGGRALRPAA